MYEPFYIEILFHRGHINKKTLPKVFGYDESFIFMHNYGKIFILSIKTGNTWKYFDTMNENNNFLLDSKQNIIKVDKVAKKIALLHRSFLVNIYETTYDAKYDDFVITSDDELAIINYKNETFLFI
jgi:hypothetical protein